MISTMRQLGLRRACAIAGVALVASAIAFFAIAARHETQYRRVNRMIAPDGTSDDERVLRTFEFVSQWEFFDEGRIRSPLWTWLARIERRSPIHLSAYSVLEGGVDPEGPCGSAPRAMLVLLRVAGVPARKLLLYEAPGLPQHTVVEAWMDGDWRVFDPSYRFYWVRDRDHKIATAADLAADPKMFARILVARPDYPVSLYHYGEVQRLKWEKIPGLVGIRTRLRQWKGDDWVRHVRTPYLYERPYLLTGSLLLVLGAAMLSVAGRSRPAGS